MDACGLETSLLSFLRDCLCLKGSKLGCDEGGCGACTVMLSHYEPSTGEIKHRAVAACLVPVCAVDGMAVTTIEGIGSTHTKLHPCQERVAKAHGSQCGFCTPGMVMSMYTLLRNNPQPSQEEVERCLDGNLCRCTGYRPILDGFKTFCMDYCCKQGGGCAGKGAKAFPALFNADLFAPLDSTQELIFPPELKINSSHNSLASTHFNSSGIRWYFPVDLKQLLVLRDMFPENSKSTHSCLVAGGTAIGQRSGREKVSMMVLVSCVTELKVMEVVSEGLLVGAAVTITDLMNKLEQVIASVPPGITKNFVALLNMLHWCAGPQIRNISTVGGNIVINSSQSDLIPVLLATDASLHLASSGHERVLTMKECMLQKKSTETFLKPNEVLVSIVVPFSVEGDHIAVYEQCKRRCLDVAIANACMMARISVGGVVEHCRLAFGGVRSHTVLANRTQDLLIGRIWDSETMLAGCKSISEELIPLSDVPGSTAEYRLCLCLSFFFKFFLQVQLNLFPDSVPPSHKTALTPFSSYAHCSSQGFQSIPDTQPLWDTIGRPLMHLSAAQQATGEARYTDDMPCFKGELYAGLVLSSRPHAKFTVDASTLEDMKGVRAFVTSRDVPGSNNAVGDDELVFADGVVTSEGQIIGVVVAENKQLAQRAVRAVKISYHDLPSVCTIEEAISQGQFFPKVRKLQCGDIVSGLAISEHILEGSMRIGGQKHFYMETNACIAIPKGEDGEMEIWAATQNANHTQLSVAKALGVPANKITVKVKRIGGGFGGKDLRCIPMSTAVSIAAHKVQAPVRIMLDRREDTTMVGGRHPFLGQYKVGFSKLGKLTAVDLQLFSNGGHSVDCSTLVLHYALWHGTNTYSVPNVRMIGRVCQTNRASNTAMRGFGGPQGMVVMETVMTHIADHLGLDAAKVREINLCEEGDTTVYGEVLTNCTIRRCWFTLLRKAEYYQRRADVQHYNTENCWRKRGLAIVPTIYGIGYGTAVLDQASALVHVYTDGSVLLTHGGMEMGQGLHTKMVQVCAHCLSLPVEKIHVSETSTDKIPNASSTAASTASDLNGMAVKNACEQIMKRLQPYKNSAPDVGWEQWVTRAYNDRINLSAQGFYCAPRTHFNWEEGKGAPFYYYSFGVGCSEVEIDTLTGSFQVSRSDLLMDVGDSLNPAIDIGQVEGAFTQGLGFFTTEECIFLKDGRLWSKGPGEYKIPGCSDIPIELNVSLLDGSPNPKAIFSSKGIGEPPLFLAASVFFAIKDAIKSAREERGHTGPFDLWSPATTERIRMACQDQFTDLVQHKQWTSE